MNCDDMIARLARSQARGWRQEMLVSELLSGWTAYVVGPYGTTVGQVKCQWSSYRNLRDRLAKVGFVIKHEPYDRKVPRSWMGLVMNFPEAK